MLEPLLGQLNQMRIVLASNSKQRSALLSGTVRDGTTIYIYWYFYKCYEKIVDVGCIIDYGRTDRLCIINHLSNENFENIYLLDHYFKFAIILFVGPQYSNYCLFFKVEM